MTVIIFEGPKMTRGHKEQLVKEFAATACKVTNMPVEKFVTLIKESSPEDVGMGTELLVNLKRG